MRTLGALLVLTSWTIAQDKPAAAPASRALPRISRHTIELIAGQYIDLDSATVLSRPVVGNLRAEIRIDRAGRFARVEGVGTARGKSMRQGTMDVRTDGGGVAKFRAYIPSQSQLASACVSWELNPAGRLDFPQPPSHAHVTWDRDAFLLAELGEGMWHITVRAGKKQREQSAEGPEVRLAPLAPDTRHTFLVRRVTESAMSAPLTLVRSQKQSIKYGKVLYPGRWYDQTGNLHVSSMSTGGDRAVDIEFYLYGVWAPDAGVKKVGQGIQAFRELRTLPRTGYSRRLSRLTDGDVFAVRLRNGCHAKLMMTGTSGDFRNGMEVHVAYLESGGYTFPEPPGNVVAARTPEGISLRWDPPPAAPVASYRITVGAQVFTSRKNTTLLKGLPKNRMHEAHVAAVLTSGAMTEAAVASFHTFEASIRVKTVTVTARRTHYSFDSGMAHPTQGDIELRGGNPSMVQVRALHGGRPTAKFGFFPVTVDERNVRFYVEARNPTTRTFIVRTKKGGMATVHLIAFDNKSITMRYAYQSPRWTGKIVEQKDSIFWKRWPDALYYVVTVNGKHEYKVKEPRLERKLLPRNQRSRLTIRAFGANKKQSEAVAHHTARYSDGFRQTKFVLNANRVTLGLRFTPVSRYSLRVEARGGFVKRPRSESGTFPPIDEFAGGSRMETINVAELDSFSFLVRGADNALVSIDLDATDWRRYQVAADCVIRHYVSTAQARARMLTAGGKPDDKTRATVAPLIELLKSPDPRRRGRAYSKLVEIGPPAAPLMEGLAQTKTSVETRRLIDRWFSEAFERHLR